jgi:lysozyme
LNYKNLKKRIKKNEGFSIKPYKDQLGFLTIGYGHLILSVEKNLKEKTTKKKKLEEIFNNDFNMSLNDFNKFLKPLIKKQKDSELLIEMIFQMGIIKVLGFKKLLYNIRKTNKYMVCFEMMNSFWYKQTPSRVKKLIVVFLKK